MKLTTNIIAACLLFALSNNGFAKVIVDTSENDQMQNVLTSTPELLNKVLAHNLVHAEQARVTSVKV